MEHDGPDYCGICGLARRDHVGEGNWCPGRPEYNFSSRAADGWCWDCGVPVAPGEPYCGECLCEEH